MSTALTKRLNQILPRIQRPGFLSSEGIGNEIACYIFDYPADAELQVREHIETIMGQLESPPQNINALHLNLLDVITEYLKHRGLFGKVLDMETQEDPAGTLKALQGPVTAEKIGDFIGEQYSPKSLDLLLLSGIGSAWPMLRTHSLLNCLHTIMNNVPVILFYPGTFDGTTLRLFGHIPQPDSTPSAKPYYRAFSLVPGGTES